MLAVRRKQVDRLRPRQSWRDSSIPSAASDPEATPPPSCASRLGLDLSRFRGLFAARFLLSSQSVMLFLRRFFVKLLVLKGLASESPPIDRKGQDPKVCLRNSPSHRYQPDLRILTRSAGSAIARHVAGGRLVHPGVSHSQFDSPHDRGRRARRVVYTRLYRVSAGKAAEGGLVVRSEELSGTLAVILAVVAVLGCVFSKQIVGILHGPGRIARPMGLAIYLNRIIFPCVLFLGLAALAARF